MIRLECLISIVSPKMGAEICVESIPRAVDL